MARKRMLDPSLWDSETFGALSFGARILWIGIISNADDEGRIKASEAYLRANVFRYDDPDSLSVHEWLSELSVSEALVLYEVSGHAYAYLPKWLEYQKINRPSKSKLPPPPECLTEPSLSPHSEENRSEGNRSTAESSAVAAWVNQTFGRAMAWSPGELEQLQRHIDRLTPDGAKEAMTGATAVILKSRAPKLAILGNPSNGKAGILGHYAPGGRPTAPDDDREPAWDPNRMRPGMEP